MTDEETVDLGVWCLGLLQDERFTRMTHEFERSSTQAILSTKPEQTTLREQIYTQYTGVQSFVSFLVGVVEKANALTTELPVDEDEAPTPTPFD